MRLKMLGYWTQGRGYEYCSDEELARRQKEMSELSDAINKLIGYDPNSEAAKARRLAWENYDKDSIKFHIRYNRTMDKALHEYHKAYSIKGYKHDDEIRKVYD